MIARVASSQRAAPIASPAMVGNKRPFPHRLHLVTGRVIEGNLHRSPNSRLADHLSTLKGYISVTDVLTDRGERFQHLVVNQDHVLYVEEVVTAAGPSV